MFRVNTQNLDLDFLTNFQNIFRFFDTLFGNFGDVDHAFVLIIQFDNRTEGKEAKNRTGNNVTDMDVSLQQPAKDFLKRFNRKANTAFFQRRGLLM